MSQQLYCVIRRVEFTYQVRGGAEKDENRAIPPCAVLTNEPEAWSACSQPPSGRISR